MIREILDLILEDIEKSVDVICGPIPEDETN